MEHRSTAQIDAKFHVEHANLEAVAQCPRCGSIDRKLALVAVDQTVSNKAFTLTDCSSCGFRSTDPRPTQKTIGTYYESEDYISHSNAARSLQDKLYQVARRWAVRNKYRLLHRFHSRGKILDLGCGTGEFLAYLKKRGFAVEGVEPSLKAREQAIREHQITVSASLDTIPLQEQFQAITLWHVLEHLHDLRGTFKKLFALIADGGHLIIAVPDRESWDATHYGEHWAAWDVPRHLSHFRRSDVKFLLEQHGFLLIEIRPMWLDAPYIAMLSEQRKGTGRTVSLIKGIFHGGYSNLISLFSKRPTSSSLFIAKKMEV